MSYQPPPTDPEGVRALLNDLRLAAANATTDREIRGLTARIASITRAYRIRHGIGMPPDPVAQALEINPRYRPRPHLTYLAGRVAQAVRDVEAGQNRMLAISMPPRAGKSTALSLYTPLWILRGHPTWKLVNASYDPTLTATWARGVRRMIEDSPELGIALARDSGSGTDWQTEEGGGLFATSVRGPMTGRGAKVLGIDDPIKDFVDAHSAVMRQSLWDWWLSVALNRLEPPYLVMVVMCLTGDTPVLMADGTEKPLRDVRPGEEVATYEDGRLVTSRVRNWASQGPDVVFTIRMESGRVVRANARHPFLTINEDGAEQWQRTDTLKPGSRIRSATGASGVESPAPRTAATSKSPARAFAQSTTARLAGLRATALRLLTRSLAGAFGSRAATGSRPKNMTGSSQSRMAGAQSAAGSRTRSTSRTTGQTSSALTTATTPCRYADCSATTATSLSRAGTPRPSSASLLTTWRVGEDVVAEVTAAGVEEVFDLQVEHTENFIANGLAAHNTRWHEDDFIGRLLSPEHEGDPKDWERISLAGLADTPDDVLGRTPGEPLLSPLFEETPEQATARWEDTRRKIGTYTFSAMIQQRPAPAKGAVFDSAWWRFWTWDAAKETLDGRVVYLDPGTLTGGLWLDSWDAAFGETTNAAASSYVVGQRWVRAGANRYLIDQQRDRWSFTQTLARMQRWADGKGPHGKLVHKRLVEKKANGAAIINVMRKRIAGIKAIVPTASKEARARAVTPECESGNVYLPHPSDPGNEWVHDLLSELRNFPYDSHDDQVDALSQALLELRDEGAAGLSVPGRVSRVPGREPPAAVTSVSPIRRRVVR